MELFCPFGTSCPVRPGFVGSGASRRATLVRSTPSPSWSALKVRPKNQAVGSTSGVPYVICNKPAQDKRQRAAAEDKYEIKIERELYLKTKK